jgi:spore germination protein KB
MLAFNEKVFGKWIGSSTTLFYVGNFMTTQVIPEMPIEAIHILFAGIVVMGLRLGLETIVRAAEIFFHGSLSFLWFQLFL